jgi:hypothetical protein
MGGDLVSKPKPQDPEKRAAKAKRRKARRELAAAGVEMLPRRARPTAQMDHASNPKSVRHAREGERAITRQRGEDR